MQVLTSGELRATVLQSTLDCKVDADYCNVMLLAAVWKTC